MARLTAWRRGAGGTDLHAVGQAVARYGHANAALATSPVSAASITQLISAATALSTAIQAAQADQPPSCVPGLAADYSAALTAFNQAAQQAQVSVAALQNNNLPTAVSDIRASTASLLAGARAIEKVDRDIAGFR